MSAGADLVIGDAITCTPASWLPPSLEVKKLDRADVQPFGAGADYTSGAEGIRRWKDLWAAGQGLQSIRGIDSGYTIVNQVAGEYEDRFVAVCPPAASGERRSHPGTSPPTAPDLVRSGWRTRRTR